LSSSIATPSTPAKLTSATTGDQVAFRPLGKGAARVALLASVAADGAADALGAAVAAAVHVHLEHRVWTIWFPMPDRPPVLTPDDFY